MFRGGSRWQSLRGSSGKMRGKFQESSYKGFLLKTRMKKREKGKAYGNGPAAKEKTGPKKRRFIGFNKKWVIHLIFPQEILQEKLCESIGENGNS